jgi:hypothetical protein
MALTIRLSGMERPSTQALKKPFRKAGILVGIAAALFLGSIVRPANAQADRHTKGIEIVQARNPGTPIMAVVSLGNQRVTVYDIDGWIMRAPVSSGRKGYETPAGIYAVIQKEVEHYSNLYEDGYMPFMQRITWSGIALHGGPLPGYPASHGCVRMPLEFAKRLFDQTRIGMRVIVARNDLVPVEFRHPVLATLNGARISEAATDPSTPPMTYSGAPPGRSRPTLQSVAVQKAAEAKAAAARADATRLESVKKTLENARISAALHLAESAKSRLELQVNVTQTALEASNSPEAQQAAEEAKTKMVAKLAEAEARFNAAALAAQHRPDVLRARQEAEAAEAESTAAAQAAAEAARKAAPVSIFISRKTQRLYVRQSLQPLFEIPVTFRDPDPPIGTHIFTALDYADNGSELRWNAISLDALPHSASTAASALERTIIPPEEIDRISELVSPGSSLIISDEGLSSETANDTDFIILMHGEPQGGIKSRHRNPDSIYRYNPAYGGFFWR